VTRTATQPWSSPAADKIASPLTGRTETESAGRPGRFTENALTPPPTDAPGRVSGQRCTAATRSASRADAEPEQQLRPRLVRTKLSPLARRSSAIAFR